MHKLSTTAENLIGSEILKISSEIKKRQLDGQDILNLTIGDYDPSIFPIPQELNSSIMKFIRHNQTNYPPASGEPTLIQSVKNFLDEFGAVKFETNEILITGGSRPGIYTTFRTILDKGESVMYPTPSWNNNHYTFLMDCEHVPVEASVDNNFLITASQIKENLTDNVKLITLCSPQNPTGTMYKMEQLNDICNVILAENKRRNDLGIKPVYLMWDQIYWMLRTNGTKHFDPIFLNKNMKEYCVYIDGTSKYFCGTGIRVGWVCGPSYIIDKMKSIIGHVGAWAPKAEQLAVAEYLQIAQGPIGNGFFEDLNRKVSDRLNSIYTSINNLTEKGYPIKCIKPSGGIYLSMMLDIDDAYNKLMEVGIGVVPFTAFGDKRDNWYRISVGTLSLEDLIKFEERINKLFFMISDYHKKSK
jgi:aspartate aminotransferase